MNFLFIPVTFSCLYQNYGCIEGKNEQPPPPPPPPPQQPSYLMHAIGQTYAEATSRKDRSYNSCFETNDS